MYGEVYTALLRVDNCFFDFLRDILACLQIIFVECMGNSLFKRCSELFGAEFMLFCSVWSKTCLQRNSFAIKKDTPVRRQNVTEIGTVVKTGSAQKELSKTMMKERVTKE